MSAIVDNLLALKILKMIVMPFTSTEAFKRGLIDAHGKKLRNPVTPEDKEAYNYLTRLVFNMKKIINRLPGGESKTKSLVAALWLVRERYESKSRSTAFMQEKFVQLVEMLDNRVSLVEEEITVKKFLDEEGMGVGAVGGAPTNNISGASVTEPKISQKDIRKYKKGQGTTIAGMVRRPTPVTK